MLLFLALYILYIYFGLLLVIQILLWISVFFLSNFLSGINPDKLEFKVIRIMSICIIIFILYYNTNHIYIASASVLPLSISKITYHKNIEAAIGIEYNTDRETFYLINKDEVSDFYWN